MLPQTAFDDISVPLKPDRKNKILFVDDEPNILSSLKRLFRSEDYHIFDAANGKQALDILHINPMDLVITDMRMPEMSGAQLLSAVKEKWPNTVRILLTGYADIQATIDAINKGNIYRYISKPWEDNDIKITVRHALEQKFLKEERQRLQDLTEKQNEELKTLNNSLEKKVAHRTAEISQMLMQLESTYDELKNSYASSVKIFSGLFELRDSNSSGHCRQVADMAHHIALKLNVLSATAQDIYFAGLLHDIGKIGLPDAILNKPYQTLTSQERQEINNHPIIGQAILISMDSLQGVATIIRSHHELFDGKGFPDGLAGQKIPLGARILAVVNEYDALQRGMMIPKKLSPAEAKNLLISQKGKRYDPQIVDIFLENLAKTETPFLPDILVLKTTHIVSGMILERDLVTNNGILLLAKGMSLDENLIHRICLIERSLKCEFQLHVHGPATP